MKALVTGSEGNIGKHLVALLEQNGYEVFCVDRKPGWRKNYISTDISNMADLVSLISWQPDVVFHLAAMVSRVTCELAPVSSLQTNIVGTQNILELCKVSGAHLVHFSTSEVYGPNNSEMAEDGPTTPNNRYGLTKLLSEELVRYEVQNNGLSAAILRPFMIYEEDEDFGDHRSALVRFAHDLAKGLPITVHKETSRGWFHVSDAVRAIEAAGKLRGFHVLNIGNPDIRSMEEIAEMVRSFFNASEDLVILEELPEQMTPHKNPKLQGQESILGVTPEVPIEVGVKLVCEKVRGRLGLF